MNIFPRFKMDKMLSTQEIVLLVACQDVALANQPNSIIVIPSKDGVNNEVIYKTAKDEKWLLVKLSPVGFILSDIVDLKTPEGVAAMRARADKEAA